MTPQTNKKGTPYIQGSLFLSSRPQEISSFETTMYIQEVLLRSFKWSWHPYVYSPVWEVLRDGQICVCDVLIERREGLQGPHGMRNEILMHLSEIDTLNVSYNLMSISYNFMSSSLFSPDMTALTLRLYDHFDPHMTALTMRLYEIGENCTSQGRDVR